MIRRAALLLILVVLSPAVTAHDTEFKPFKGGSFDQLLATYRGRPFMLVLWSANCETCIRQFGLLRELSREKPRVAMVLVSTDDIATQPAAGELLSRYNLEHEDVWMFADGDTAKLRSEIDTRWDGKVPRTYLYDAAHSRQTLTGNLDRGRVFGWTQQVNAMH